MQAKTEKTKARYNRIAPIYDCLTGLIEGALKERRKILWDKVQGKHVLEVGVGTGKNFAYYPPNTQMTGIDFSEEMIKRAKTKRQNQGVEVELVCMDVRTLCYADNSFDTVIATFVFCSVPQPVKGLQELYRVCKPGGRVLLFEHVLSANPMKAKMMKWLDPLIVFLVGASIIRETVKNVQSCGFTQVTVDSASSDMVKLIQAIK